MRTMMTIARKIRDHFKKIVDDECKVMDAFYGRPKVKIDE